MRNQYKILEEKYAQVNVEGKRRMGIPDEPPPWSIETHARCEKVLGIKNKNEIIDFINFIHKTHPEEVKKFRDVDDIMYNQAWDAAKSKSNTSSDGFYGPTGSFQAEYKQVMKDLYKKYLDYKAAKANIDKGSEETGWDLSALDEKHA